MSFVLHLTNNIGPTSVGVNTFITIVLLTLITNCDGGAPMATQNTHFRPFQSAHARISGTTQQNTTQHNAKKKERKPLFASFSSRGKARGRDLQAPDCLLLEPGYESSRQGSSSAGIGELDTNNRNYATKHNATQRKEERKKAPFCLLLEPGKSSRQGSSSP